ncbi:Rpn family recombination-promoting nuclease/putative transposase [Duganella sp.]|uniref:Rpn family recombination-promoting nuclease/putative transposase n=1 Tax=Duganella sp. TaxID=1904440 RepID=UPI0031D23CB1
MTATADALYKQLFSHPEIVRDLVAGFLPAEWAQQLEVGAFERVNASYASDEGKARHEDVVWRARIDGEWVYVYILLEFQSRPDKWMALRMQVYIGLLYQDLVAQHKLSKHGKLPPVLPIVFYHGHRPWRAATELAELMLPPPEGLEQFQASQRYVLIDQHHDWARGDIVPLLFRLLRSRTETERAAALNMLLARLMLPDLAPIRASLQHWLLLTLRDAGGSTNIEWEEGLVMNAKRQPRFNELITEDFIRRLVQPQEEALQEGVQQGMQQGMQQGELLALQGVLRDLLAGDVTVEAAGKIAQADVGQLRAWIKSLFAGASPRQLFAEG